jgi:hypothetical protein
MKARKISHHAVTLKLIAKLMSVYMQVIGGMTILKTQYTNHELNFTSVGGIF